MLLQERDGLPFSQGFFSLIFSLKKTSTRIVCSMLIVLLLGALCSAVGFTPVPQLQTARMTQGGTLEECRVLRRASPLRGGEARGAQRQPALARVRSFLDKRFFLVGIAGAIGLAALSPEFGCRGGPLRPELTVGWGAPCGIFLIAGLSMPSAQLAKAAMRVRTHAAVQGFNLVLIPLVMTAISRAALATNLLSKGLCDGLLVVSALPTTVNMCVSLSVSAKGNEALAIFNAVIGNLAGVFVSPLLIMLLVGQTGSLPFVEQVVSLNKKVLLPLLLGQLLRRAEPVKAAVKTHKKKFSRTSEALLLLTVYSTFCDTFLRGFGIPASTFGVLFAIMAASHFAFLGAAWLMSGWLTVKDRITFLFVSTQKTLAFGLPLLRIVFQGRPDLAVLLTPLLLLHPLQLLVGSLLVPRLAALAEAEEKRTRD